MRALRIILVDDHPIVRAGFRQLLDMQSGWGVVELGSAAELAAYLRGGEVDVLVLDLSLADADGLVLIRQVLAVKPTLPIIVLSMHDSALYVQDALAAGAGRAVDRVVRIVDTPQTRVVPMAGAMLKEAMAPPTPIEGGPIEITASIELTVALR